METITVNIHEAKAKLSGLIARVERGDRVQIARRGHVVVQLMPVPADDALERFDALRARDRGPVRSLDELDALVAEGRP